MCKCCLTLREFGVGERELGGELYALSCCYCVLRMAALCYSIIVAKPTSI